MHATIVAVHDFLQGIVIYFVQRGTAVLSFQECNGIFGPVALEVVVTFTKLHLRQLFGTSGLLNFFRTRLSTLFNRIGAFLTDSGTVADVLEPKEGCVHFPVKVMKQQCTLHLNAL